jgi:predicted molibdopterin-dependent oxidoreductase YjgC
MFKPHHSVTGNKIEITVDDKALAVTDGDNLAAQLIFHDILPIRHDRISGEARAPHCMIGNCFECLVEIDGVPNQQACMTEVHAGMNVRRDLIREGGER